MLERVELSIQIHFCMWTLQSTMNDVQRLVYSRGAVVLVRQLAQLVRNSLHGVQPNCGVPPHLRGHAELAGHALLHPEKERMLRAAPVQEQGPTQYPTRESHQRTEISAARDGSDAHHKRHAGCAGAHGVPR